MTEKWHEKKISRRSMLKMTGIGAAGAIIGASGFGGVMKVMSDEPLIKEDNASSINKYDFYNTHQPGIITPAQTHIYFASLTILFKDAKTLQDVLQLWTPMIVSLMNGEEIAPSTNGYIPPIDTGEAIGLDARHCTVTVGISASLFNKIPELESKRPKELQDLPHFPKDQLDPAYTGGDICIQACADDPQVAFHAVRNLVRVASGKVEVHWAQAGFNSFPKGGGTPRNLFAFKDGTENPQITDKEDLKRVVWVQPGESKAWLTNGTYLAVRRIQMHLETWDRTAFHEQENTFGRHRDSGAPLGSKREFDQVDITAKDENGELLMPETSHVHLAKKVKARMLRRSYSYASGTMTKTGAHDAGLLFISFQKHPQQFIDIQNSFGRLDKLNEYITHRGSALFACFPGVEKGSYLGEALFK